MSQILAPEPVREGHENNRSGSQEMVALTYQPRNPSSTVLYQVVADHLDTFLAGLDADPTAKGLPAYVRDEFQAYLKCGILAHGFLRLGCDTCPHQSSLQRRKGAARSAAFAPRVPGGAWPKPQRTWSSR